VYDNTATATASNDDPVEASASTEVICPQQDKIDVVADVPLPGGVPGGDDIGFTLTGSNPTQPIDVTPSASRSVLRAHGAWSALPTVAGVTGQAVPGAVRDVVLTSNLPDGNGIDWSIDKVVNDDATCSISGNPGSQKLTCTKDALLPQESFSVHITSPTACPIEGTFTDLGTLASSNVPTVTDQDATQVLACPTNVQRPPTSRTGTPVEQQLSWAIGLILVGALVLIVGARRRRGEA
jgi:hypothetical protein